MYAYMLYVCVFVMLGMHNVFMDVCAYVNMYAYLSFSSHYFTLLTSQRYHLKT